MDIMKIWPRLGGANFFIDFSHNLYKINKDI
jgi:hypothetical protein